MKGSRSRFVFLVSNYAVPILALVLIKCGLDLEASELSCET